MSITLPYKIGELVFLQQSISQGEPITYKTRFADFTDQFIAIEMPLSETNGKMGFFPEGCEIDVWFYSHDGSTYSFTCTVLGRKKERIPMTLITYPEPESIKRVQRRQFLRVDCKGEVAIHPKSGTLTPFLAKAIDLSGGGMAFARMDNPTDLQGEFVEWWLSLPNKSTNTIEHSFGVGKVVRIIEPYEAGLPYKCSLQFIELSETNRQKVIRYCFERQLELKKKGIQSQY